MNEKEENKAIANKIAKINEDNQEEKRDELDKLYDSEVYSDWLELQNMEYDPVNDTLY